MKFLFWLLLILNLGAAVYFNIDKLAPQPLPTVKPDIQPDKLTLLSSAEVDAMPKRMIESTEQKSLPISNEPVACYEWGSFSQDSLIEVQTILNALNVNFTTSYESNEAIRYWVYKSPLPSAEAAQAKAREIKALGIEDFFIVQEPKMRNAISFGVFRDETLANKLMDDLRRRGVRELVKSQRNQGNAASTLTLTNVTETLYEQLKKNEPDYPLASFKSTSCTTE
jgi:hypothetical protein